MFSRVRVYLAGVAVQIHVEVDFAVVEAQRPGAEALLAHRLRAYKHTTTPFQHIVSGL